MHFAGLSPAKVGITAPPEFDIVREELLTKQAGQLPTPDLIWVAIRTITYWIRDPERMVTGITLPVDFGDTLRARLSRMR